MRLESIAGRLPGRKNFNLCTDRPVFLVGPNDSGKTTMLTSVRLALQGGIPAPVDDDMVEDWSVVAHFSDDSGDVTVHRSQPLGRSQTVRVEGIGEVHTRVKVANEVLRDSIGAAGVFSASDWLGRSDTKRLAAFNDLGVTRADVSVDRATDVLDAAGIGLASLAAFASSDRPIPLPSSAMDGLEVEWCVPFHGDGVGFVGDLVDWVRVCRNDLQKQIERVRHSLEQTRMEHAEAHELPGGVARWEARVAELQEERRALAERIGQMRGVQRARDMLETTLARSQVVLDRLPSDAPRISAQKELDCAVAAEATARAEHDSAEQALADHRAKRAGLKAGHEAVAERVRDLRARRAALDGLEPLVSAAQQVVDQEPETLAALPEAVQTAIAGLRQVLNALVGDDAKVELDVANQAMQVSRVALDEHIAADKALQARLASLLSTLRSSQQQVSFLRSKVQQVEAEHQRLAEARVAAAQRQLEAQQELVDLPDTSELASLEDTDRTLQDSICEATAQLTAFEEERVRRIQHEERTAALRDATRRRDSLLQLYRKLEDIHRRLMREGIDRLQDAANRIVVPVLGCDLELDNELVPWLRYSSRRVRVADASHSERTVALAALQVAVMMRVSGWRSVMLDDIEHMGPERRYRFVRVMAQLQLDSAIDNVVLAWVDDGAEDPFGADISEFGVLVDLASQESS